MTTRLARSALRAHRPAFTGTVVAALFASTVVSAATCMLASTDTDGLPPRLRTAVARSGVGETATVLLIGAVYLSIFVIASTMGTAVAQQHREFAMLRAIGARPGQLRRAVAVQALAAAVPAAPAGCALGWLAGAWWHAGAVAHGLLPHGVPYAFSWAALLASLGVAVLTSAPAGVLAVLRFARLRPSRALAEAAAGRRGLGWARAPLGVVAAAGGAEVSLLLARQHDGSASEGAFVVLLLFCVATGLLGPRIVGPAAWLCAAVARPFGAGAELATRTVRSQPRRFSAAVVPLVLMVAFGTTKLALRSTVEHRTGSPGPSAEVWLDYLGTGLYAGFAAIAAANTLAVISSERRRDVALLRLVGTRPSQVAAMVAWEAAIVTLTALLLGGAVALATLAPLLSESFGTALPYVPLPLAAAIAGSTLLLAWLATGVPVARGLRQRPVETLRTA